MSIAGSFAPTLPRKCIEEHTASLSLQTMTSHKNLQAPSLPPGGGWWRALPGSCQWLLSTVAAQTAVGLAVVLALLTQVGTTVPSHTASMI